MARRPAGVVKPTECANKLTLLCWPSFGARGEMMKAPRPETQLSRAVNSHRRWNHSDAFPIVVEKHGQA